MTTLAARLAPMKAWWAARAPRERLYASAGLGILLLYLLFALAVRPAWRTLATAPTRLDGLDAELQQMKRLAAETQELRSAPPVNSEQSTAALKAATERLGDKGKLVLQGDRAVLTLNGAGTAQLRDWLAEARSGARARPVEANLTRSGDGYNGSIVVAVGGGA